MRLDQSARSLGEAWAQRARDDLSLDRRPLVGGWPGTLSEARAYTRAHFANTAVRRLVGPLTTEEFEHAARAVYARARMIWLGYAERDTGEL